MQANLHLAKSLTFLLYHNGYVDVSRAYHVFFYATNTIVALSENPLILAWNIWRQARWWLWDCLMCHPKAYWKVSLFRTTTGEKFEIRYINVVRVESSGFWSYIHTHTRCDGGGKKVYPITYFFGVAALLSASVFSNFQRSWQCILEFRSTFSSELTFSGIYPFFIMTQIHLVRIFNVQNRCM